MVNKSFFEERKIYKEDKIPQVSSNSIESYLQILTIHISKINLKNYEGQRIIEDYLTNS